MKHNASLGILRGHIKKIRKLKQPRAGRHRGAKELPTEVKLTAAPTAPAPETPTTTALQLAEG